MSDFADAAFDMIEQHEAVSLANHQAKQLKTSSKYCKDCHIDIPAKRLAAVIAIRCADCQAIFETKKHRF